MSIFNEKINRLETASVKWEMVKDVFGAEDLWPMWVADMDFKPPQAVIDALRNRAEHGVFGYTFVPTSAMDAIEKWLKKRHGWQIHTSWLEFCSGVVQGISTAINALTKEGDKVLVQSPVYTPFFDMIAKNNRVVVNAQLELVEGRYEIDFSRLEEALKEGCKLFILCNPHNPAGRVWAEEELLRIGELCEQYDCLILSDEIHSDLIYKNDKHIPIASLSEELANRTVTFIAPSKTFNLAGLHTSVAIIKKEELRTKFHEQLTRQGFFSLNTFGIIGMEAAYLEGESWLEELLDYLEDNMNVVAGYLAEHLPEIHLVEPEGTYLLWLDCRELGLSDEELRIRLIEKGKLALEPGTKYGPGGEGFVRMNIACPREMLQEGLDRLKIALS